MSFAIDLHIGRRIRRRRLLLSLSQGALGEACGVRFQQIQKYECGAARVSAPRIWELAQALGVPVGYFFDGLGQRQEEGNPSRVRPEPRRFIP